jgi:hypothetical protein
MAVGSLIWLLGEWECHLADVVFIYLSRLQVESGKGNYRDFFGTAREISGMVNWQHE